MRKLSAYAPHATVFFASMGIMIIELVASRIVSKYFGNSLYTWTGVIGIVLGGISLGNYLGGRLADRYEPKRIIPYLLLTASFFILLILLVDFLLEGITYKSEIFGVTGSAVLKSFLLIFVLFFLPSTCLGTVSPVMAKAALEERRRIGSTVGVIYALASIGSIVGTFLSGFLLIPLLGVRTILCAVAFVIAFLALTARKTRILVVGWLIIVAVFSALISRGLFESWSVSRRDPSIEILYEKDSAYSHIKVLEGIYNSRRERVLVMDGLIHNRYNPDDPDDLIYDYERTYLEITDAWLSFTGKEEFSTLTIGGGACQFPALLDRRYPRSRNEIAEIDPQVIRVAYGLFDLQHSPRLNIVIADARSYVNSIGGNKKYDIIYLDAFNSYSVPSHLTTREFSKKLAHLLDQQGVVIANIIDIYESGKFLAAYINTLREIFPYLFIFPNSNYSPEKRATFVILASRVRPPQEIIRSPGAESVFHRLSSRDVEELIHRVKPRSLTDDYAPVEYLIAPVFVRSVR